MINTDQVFSGAIQEQYRIRFSQLIDKINIDATKEIGNHIIHNQTENDTSARNPLDYIFGPQIEALRKNKEDIQLLKYCPKSIKIKTHSSDK